MCPNCMEGTASLLEISSELLTQMNEQNSNKTV